MQTEKQPLAQSDQEAASSPSYKSWQAIGATWWQATRAILPTFLLTRLIFLLLTYFGGVLFFVPNYSPANLSLKTVVMTWQRWDADRFVTIANQGYTTPEYTAFFPLYPALMRALSDLTGLNPLLSGMLISNLAFLGVLIVLFRLVESEFDQETARLSTLYLAVFPSALFFFAAYNESLFLLFMLLSFYTLRRGYWWQAGLFGFLATLTRSIGLFLALIFLCEFLRQRWPLLQEAWHAKNTRVILLTLSNLLAIILIPLGLVIYAYGLAVRFGDPLAFMHAQVYWRSGLTFPWVAPLIGIQSILRLSPFTFAVPHIIIELCSLTLFLILLLLACFGPERLHRSQWTFILFGFLALIYSLIFPGSPGPGGIPYDPMPSMQRFVLEIFVGFVLLARLGRRPWFHTGYLLLALPMLAFLVLQFLTGHWTV